MGRPPTIKPQELLETARRVFVQKGYDRTTLADIAGELHVTAAALLRHCRSKHELFLSAMTSGNLRVPEFVMELQQVDAAADPRVVLRHLAEQFIPFVQQTLALNLAVYAHERSQTSFVIPFDTRNTDSPPRRGLQIVTDYFRRAAAAGVMRVRDPRAAALVFMGSLQSYVFLHHVLNVAPKPYPLEPFLDQLMEVWTSGAIVVGGSRGKQKTPGRATDPAPRAGRRGGGNAAVHAGAPKAAGRRPQRIAGGEDGQRRVARGRPRGSRPRR